MDPKAIAYYGDGDIPAEWSSYIQSISPKDLEGVWELILERSDCCDALMESLGIGTLKRRVLKNYKTRIEMTALEPGDENSAPRVRIVTHLPMGRSKRGDVHTDGGCFEQEDNDTGVTWLNESLFAEGKLLQKRTSGKGVMYDVRCILNGDPEGKCSVDGPIQLFRWTLVTPEGQRIVADRWLKKIK